jgi:alginate O-acetyltransferase complex protein AlgJ
MLTTPSQPHSTPIPATDQHSQKSVSGPRRAAAAVLIAVMLAGGVQLGMAAFALAGSGTAPSLRDPTALERTLEDKIPARQTMIGLVNALRFRLLGGTNDQVRLGTGGWIYLKAELLPRPEASQSIQVRAAAVVQLQRQLAARGTRLLIAVSPNKTRIEAAYLRGGLPAGYPVNGYQQFQSLLQAAHVDTVDLAAPLAAAGGERYYRNDTHWNNRGAGLAAQAIGRALSSWNIQGGQDFVTRPTGPAQERPGDLLHLMGLEHVPDGWRPPADHEVPVQTTELGISSAGLLGAGDAVVLVGSSYCLRGNFQGALEQALRHTVINAAREGADYAGSLREYLADPAFAEAPPSVLIWEIPERFLAPTPGPKDLLPDLSAST